MTSRGSTGVEASQESSWYDRAEVELPSRAHCSSTFFSLINLPRLEISPTQPPPEFLAEGALEYMEGGSMNSYRPSWSENILLSSAPHCGKI